MSKPHSSHDDDMLLLSPADVSRRLGVDVRVVREWIRAGDLKAIDIGTNPNFPRYRISENSLNAFLVSRGASRNADGRAEL